MKISKNLAYLLGAFRDGCLTTQYTIKFKQKNRQWLSDVLLPISETEFGIKQKSIWEQKDRATRYYFAFKNKKL